MAFVSASFYQHTGIIAGTQGITNQLTITAGGLVPWEGFYGRCNTDETSIKNARIHGRNTADTSAGGNAADMNIADGYYVGSFRTASTPNDVRHEVFRIDAAATLTTCKMQGTLNTSRQLSIHDSTNEDTDTALVTFTTPCALNTVYFWMAHCPTTAAGNATVWLYDTSYNVIESQVIAGNWLASNNLRLHLGIAKTLHANTGIDMHYGGWTAWDALPTLGFRSCFLNATAVGSLNDAAWVPSTGSDKVAVIDDLPMQNTTYMAQNTEAAASPQSISYYHQTLAQVGAYPQSIIAVAPVCPTHSSDSATTAFRTALISGGTTTLVPPTSAYQPGTTALAHARGHFYTTDPNTGAAWTPSAVNASEIGVQWSTGTSARLNGAGLMVWYYQSPTYNKGSMMLLGVGR